jgi:hypothetical protein
VPALNAYSLQVAFKTNSFLVILIQVNLRSWLSLGYWGCVVSLESDVAEDRSSS